MLRIYRGLPLTCIRRWFATKYNDQHVMSRKDIARVLGKSAPASETTTSTSPALQKIDLPEAEKVDIKELIHGLPATNEPFPVVYDEEEARIIHETPTQNLYKLLQLNPLSSYRDYTSLLKSAMHHEVDMYGDQAEPPVIGNLEFASLLTPNSPYLADIRKRYVMNINLPGAIENENPNSFLQLRPIEEFRHTPLIPISESAMRNYKEMLQEYHRRAFVLEIRKESIINFGLVLVASSICFYLIREVVRKEEEVAVSYQRLKHRRILGDDRRGSLL